MAYLDTDEMKGLSYIAQTRAYLDYIEEHLINVRLAFLEVNEACKGRPFIYDDTSYFSLITDVKNHDLSKFSCREFVQYRQRFYPVEGEIKSDDDFEIAVNFHKIVNKHHWESVQSVVDVVHMVIDWLAMSYKFNSSARQFYKDIRPKLNNNVLSYESIILNIFDDIDKLRSSKEAG